MKHLFFVLILFNTISSAAQVTMTSRSAGFVSGMLIIKSAEGKQLNVDDTPYLFSIWQPAEVELRNGNTINQPTKVILDVLDDKVFIEMNGDKQFKIEPWEINRIKMTTEDGKRNFVSFSIKEVEKRKEETFRIYEEIFSHPDLILLKKNTKTYSIKLGQSPYHGSNSELHKYTSSSSFYVKQNQDGFKLIRPSKKSIIAMFPNKSKKIKQIVKEQNLDLKETDDLKSLLNQIASH